MTIEAMASPPLGTTPEQIRAPHPDGATHRTLTWWLALIFQVVVAAIAAALLLLFAFVHPPRPLGADSYLISSPQSIGGHS